MQDIVNAIIQISKTMEKPWWEYLFNILIAVIPIGISVFALWYSVKSKRDSEKLLIHQEFDELMKEYRGDRMYETLSYFKSLSTQSFESKIETLKSKAKREPIRTYRFLYNDDDFNRHRRYLSHFFRMIVSANFSPVRRF